MRKIDKTYSDPLDLIWIHAAAEIGMRIERSAEVNASWNGAGVLTIGTTETLDPDDCLAQIILHETCHALCEGPAGWHQPDWGIDNFDPAKKVHEYACLRVQAGLADLYGLRTFFAATTVFRGYYDRLSADPLTDGEEPSISMARSAWQRFEQGPWSVPLHDALRRTAIIAQTLHGVTTPTSLWHTASGN